MNTTLRFLRFASLFLIAVMAYTLAPSAHALPNDLRLVISTSDGTQTLNLHKRTARTADCSIYQWSSAGGYVPIIPEVRTFRGTIAENPNAIVIASIGGDNKLRAYCIDMEWGHNFRWTVSGLDVSSQLTTPDTNPTSMPAQVVGSPLSGTPGVPKIGPKVPASVAPNGVPYGSIVEYELGLDLTVAAYNRAGQNIDTLLAEYDSLAMVYELMMLRDMHVRVVVPTIVIRMENFFSTDPGAMGLTELLNTWKAAPLFTARWDGVWGSEGWYASSGIGKDESSVSAGALYHENTHTWGAFHLAYQCDTMGGNKPSIGPMTVDVMLKKRKEAIDENKLPVSAPFTDPLPPHTHVDAVRTLQNTPVIIDVMANDHDANGDALSISSFTTNTVSGGIVQLVGNSLRYTPPPGFAGKDIIAYTVQDSSAMGLKTREVVHIEVVNQNLMVSYQMEETSGDFAANSVPGGSAGDLNGGDFATGRVVSPLGHGLRVNGFANENDIENALWSGLLVGSGNVMPVPLNPSRSATPFDEEYNRHSAHYDIMDGDYTFATWFRSDSYNGADYPGGFSMAYIASRWWHPETRVGWDMYAMNGIIGLHYRVFDGATGIQHFSTPYNLVAGKWYHMAAVFDRSANEIRILVNGQVVATKGSAFSSNGYIFNGRAPLALGAFSEDHFCYDDTRIYSKALTTPEVQTLVAQAGAGVPRFLEPTVQYATFAGLPFNQSLWGNIWSGGDEPLTFQILDGPAWLNVDSAGILSGNPRATDAGLSTATIRITDSNGDTATATMNISIPTVPTNAIAHWKLDEGAGATAADSSANGYNGTITGATWDMGHVNGSLSFAGGGNQVVCGNVPTSTQMSFAAWIKPSDVSGVKGLIGKTSSYAIKMSGSDIVYTRPGVADYSIGGINLAPNVWQHIVLTIDGNQTNGMKLYKNGVMVSQRTASAPSANSNPVLLGNNQWSQYFTGNLDHVQIFNSVLNADQAGALYAATYGGGLFASWKFDEVSGLTAADSSGNGNTGTLDSGIGWTAGYSGNAVAMTTTKKISLGGKPGPLGDWTFATWVQRKGNTTSAILVDSSSSVIKLEQYNNTHRVGITRRGVADWAFNYTTPLNQWVHLAFVGGNGAVKLYVNGVLQDTLAQAISMPFTSIGSAAEGMNAWLDETVVYERMLSAQEVAGLYYGGNNSGPVWNANPLNKTDAFEDAAYSGTLAGDATDANGGPLTYRKSSGPAWLNVAADGALSGTPGRADVGAYPFSVSVTDGAGLSATTTLNIVVIHTNHAPTFVSNPISKPNATVGTAYSSSIATDATDIDAGDTRTFNKLSGPPWLSVAANGVLSGTPPSGSGGMNSFSVRVTDSGMLYADATLNVTVFDTLPSGWAASDIGSVSIAGSASESAGTYTVTGSGADIWGTADAFQFVSQTLVGDGEIRARVTSQTNTHHFAKAGVMIRDGGSAGAVNALLAITPGEGFDFQWRATVSGASTYLAGPALNGAPNNWVRLTRSGTLVTAYVSANGTAWTQVGTVNLTMASSVSVGLAVSSVNDSALSTATFDNVAITPFPAPWLSADLGTTGLAGSAEYFGNAYTVKGAGTFGGTADGFRYAYQTLSGDGSVVARVSTLQNTGTSARIGVMIRDTLTNNARMAALTVNGSGAWRWQRRTSTGGSVSTTNSSSGVAPNLWVRLVRSGNTIIASRSTNGTTWTTISSVTVTMATNCYIGLCDASGSTTTLNTSALDNVTVVP